MRQFILSVINIFLLFGCSDIHTHSLHNCTTKVILFWDGATLLEKKKILNEAFSINVNKDMRENLEDVPISELGTFKDYEWIYFIYASNKQQCQEKVKYTNLALERYLKSVTDAPKYKIIRDISDKELNIIQHQDKYNEKNELIKWLNAETERQLQDIGVYH